MLLTKIAQELTDTLNSSPEKWCSESGVKARLTLDWATCLKADILQVLIVPDFVQFNLEQSQGRREWQQLNTIKYISVIVGRKFKMLPTSNDVAPWEECKSLVDTRERVVQFALANPVYGYKVTEIEEQPIDEMELNNRNFVAVSALGYGVEQCGSGPDLLSS